MVWDSIDRETGRPLIDCVFPKPLQREKNEAEMSVTLATGARWYAVGSDNYDRLVGSDPVGVVFSEYALADPSAWNYIRPILAENGGWAMFLYTPRGRNHGYTLFNMAAGNPDWFCEQLSVEQTKHISLDEIEAERRAGMEEELLRQEFWCSFAAGASGAYYAKEMEAARGAGRITRVPYDPQWPLEYWFDLGYNDATTVWAVQPAGLELRLIKYGEWRAMGIPRIAEKLRAWGLKPGLLRLPHDGEAHDQTSGRTRREVWEDEMGCASETTPRPRNKDELAEQMACARSLIPTCVFDAEGCESGIYALESYAREFDEKTKRHRDNPKHDWSSHGADAFRTGAVRVQPGGAAGASELQPDGRRAMLRARPKVIRAAPVRRGMRKSVDWRNLE